eukprot:164908-Prymnesium_polylepis.1
MGAGLRRTKANPPPPKYPEPDHNRMRIAQANRNNIRQGRFERGYQPSCAVCVCLLAVRQMLSHIHSIQSVYTIRDRST